ncbi:MAG: hypothetical protein ACJATN_002141 [Neolewinella sp.]|jgi:hypothetical protein
MLSICIPTYRYDVCPLVADLLQQAVTVNEAIEVLVYDDASPDDGDWGRAELRQTSGIRYIELKTNLGRAAIRNKMTREASHKFVLLMDADGWPPPDFLGRYLKAITALKLPAVIIGGRTYTSTPPVDYKLHLHWWYGSQREARTPGRISQDGWLGFQSNNFLTTRALLLAHPFPESHHGYGHEDTLWGQQFVGTEVSIHPGNNPVVHLGLETNEIFLQKQRQAIDNLRLLKKQSPHLRTRLINLVEKLPFLPTLAGLISEQTLVNYLNGQKRPNLYALDVLKLRWWIK